MSELTKGPWKAKRLATYQDPGWVVLWPDKGGTHMRRLDSNGNFTGPDAALIAAAPELLAAAIKVNALSIQSEAHKQLRLAIAKATDLSGARGASPVLRVRVPPALMERAEELAAAAGMSVAYWVRGLIERARK